MSFRKPLSLLAAAFAVAACTSANTPGVKYAGAGQSYLLWAVETVSSTSGNPEFNSAVDTYSLSPGLVPLARPEPPFAGEVVDVQSLAVLPPERSIVESPDNQVSWFASPVTGTDTVALAFFVESGKFTGFAGDNTRRIPVALEFEQDRSTPGYAITPEVPIVKTDSNNVIYIGTFTSTLVPDPSTGRIAEVRHAYRVDLDHARGIISAKNFDPQRLRIVNIFENSPGPKAKFEEPTRAEALK